MRTSLMALALLSCSLAACDSKPEEAPPSGQASVPATSNAALTGGALRVEPSMLPDCSPARVLVRWNAGETGEATEVNVVVENTDELFAEGGATGQSETGPWVRPGTTFVLQDRGAKKELARASVGGPSCD